MNKKLQDIVYDIAEREGYYFSQLVSRTRTKHLVTVRHACWNTLSKEGYSPEEIAEVFSEDASSIRYGLRKHNGKIKGKNETS
jgi:hypothetical protein